MTLPLERRRHSLADYYRIENESAEKLEFHDGEILAMSGGSPDHSLIAMNTGTSLTLRLRGGTCRVYDSNLRVRIPGESRCCYPDLTVICGPVARDAEDKSGQAVTNPQVIVEVLSASTEAYDRGAKFSEYKAIPSFKEYVLIDQSRPRVEIRRRQADGKWSPQVYEGFDANARIESLGIDLPLNEIYVGADFPVQ